MSVQPNAAGITWNSNSTATPTVAHSHMTAFATVANIESGTGRPGLARFHCAIARIMIAHQIHDPATTSTSPI